MDSINKKVLKALPYIAALLSGGIFYTSSYFIKDENLYDLFINISATFLAIPLLYLFYEITKSFSHKRLNKEIFDYAKLQVDREILSVTNQLQKIVYSLDEKGFTTESINEFLGIKKEKIKNNLSINKYLGFQIFKHWEIIEKNLNELLKNPFILKKLEDQQIISIISIFKSLIDLETIQKFDHLYSETEEIAEGYKITIGSDINPENSKLPNRHILMKHLKDNKFIVHDFGDIPKSKLNKCLKYYKINDIYINHYTEVIYNVLKAINEWLNATGLEFVVDPKHFNMKQL